jgi:very-short-patch-repair endonuclease
LIKTDLRDGSSPFGRGRLGGGWEGNELSMSSTFNRTESKNRRRYLRKNMTRAEKLLWGKLQKSQLNCLRFRRQYGVLNYILDFYCPQYKLGIEIIGDVHGYSGRQKFDLHRKRKIESLGIKLLSYTNSQVVEEMDGVLKHILFNLPQPPPY